MDFTVLDDHRVKIKENEMRGKYLDLARELKKLWTMMMTVISDVIYGKVPENLRERLENLLTRGQIKTTLTAE